MSYKLPYKIPNPVPFNESVIKKETFEVFYKGRILAKKRYFEVDCSLCKKIFSTTRNNQLKRKFPWLCRSCKQKEEWQSMTKKERQERQSESIRKNRRPENRKRSSEKMKKAWQDKNSYWNSEDFIPPMHREKSRKKLSKTIKKKLLDDSSFREEFLERMKNAARGTLIKCAQPDGKIVTLRSTYEHRVAKILTLEGFDWKYEYKTFFLKDLDTSYTPDFYIPSLDLWVEVKGFWQNKSEDKWKDFSKDKKTCLLFEKDIKELENGEEIENKIN